MAPPAQLFSPTINKPGAQDVRHVYERLSIGNNNNNKEKEIKIIIILLYITRACNNIRIGNTLTLLSLSHASRRHCTADDGMPPRVNSVVENDDNNNISFFSFFFLF